MRITLLYPSDGRTEQVSNVARFETTHGDVNTVILEAPNGETVERTAVGLSVVSGEVDG